MKKKFLLIIAAAFISVSSLMAQDKRQMATPEERTKATMEKLAKFDMKPEARTKVENILTEYYKAQQTSMQEMRASGNNDKNAMMEKRKQLADDRDKKLKEIFTAEEYTKWISEIEPSLRPQRGMNAPVAAPAEKAAPAKN